MKQCLFILILLFTLTFKSSSLYPQEWSEPLNITNLGGYSMDPDMVIDHNGIIHVVWSYRIEDWYWKIMYTRSEDDGNTWDEPLDLLQNTDLWMSQPHIDCDSKNHLYVAYTFNTMNYSNMLIKMVIYDGHQWSDPILVSEGMPGSDYSKVITDNNDQILLGWYRGGKFYYRFYCNPIFSEIYCPYCNEEDIFLPVEGALTKNQQIHWIGSSASYNYNGERLEYYLFDIGTNSWTKPQMPVQDTITVGIDIALNNDDFPECVYRKKSETSYNASDSTKFISKEGNYWGNPELIAGVNGYQTYQQIAVDQNNDVHIVERQGTLGDQKLVHYKKKDNNWVGQNIDTFYAIAFPKLLFNANMLYCMYEKAWEAEKEVEYDLFYTKYDIITDIKEEPNQQPELEVYPNPTIGSIYIEFENNKEQHNDLSVYDISGKHIITLINKNLPQGKQQLLWTSTDKKGKGVNSGSYVVRLKSGRKSVSQIVEIVR